MVSMSMEEETRIMKKNDLHFYSRQTNSWAEIVPNGSVPARQAPTAVWSNQADGFYVFGGCCWENDLHFYSRESNSWEKLSPAGTLPLGREGGNQCGGMPQMVSTCAEATRAILESLLIWLFTLEPPMRGSGFGPQVPRQMPATTTPWYGVKLMTDSISLEVMPTSRKTMDTGAGALFKEMICISTQGRQTRGKNWSLAACHTSMHSGGRRLFLHALMGTQLYGANKMTDSMFLEAIPAPGT